MFWVLFRCVLLRRGGSCPGSIVLGSGSESCSFSMNVFMLSGDRAGLLVVLLVKCLVGFGFASCGFGGGNAGLIVVRSAD